MAQITLQRILSPDLWREKQLGTLKAVGEKNYRVRIARPRKDPIQAGIAAEDRYAEAIKEAIEKKSRVLGLRATDSAEWLSYAEAIGAPRLVDGVLKREPEVKDFIDIWQPELQAFVTEKLDPMPVVTLKERIDKAIADIEGLHARKGFVKEKLARG